MLPCSPTTSSSTTSSMALPATSSDEVAHTEQVWLGALTFTMPSFKTLNQLGDAAKAAGKGWTRKMYDELDRLKQSHRQTVQDTCARAIHDKVAYPTLMKFLEQPTSAMWRKSFAGLKECHCAEGHEFDRHRNDRRARIERAIIERISADRPVEQCGELSYFSLGCGKGLEDFITLGLLLKHGYKNIHATLCDPEMAKPQDIENIQRAAGFELLRAAAEEVDGHISIEATEVCLPQSKVDLLCAVDYDGLYARPKQGVMPAMAVLALASRYLSELGSLHLSFGYFDAILARGNGSRLLWHDAKATSSPPRPFFEHFECPGLQSTLQQQLLQLSTEHNRIAIIGSAGLGEWMAVLLEAHQLSMNIPLHLTVAQPRDRKGQVYEGFSAGSLSLFLSKVYHGSVQVKVAEEHAAIPDEQDLVICWQIPTSAEPVTLDLPALAHQFPGSALSLAAYVRQDDDRYTLQQATTQ